MMSSRRRKRGGGPFVVVVLILAAAAVTWWLWPEEGGPGPETTFGEPSAIADAEPVVPPSEPVAPPQGEAVGPAPATVEFTPPTEPAPTPIPEPTAAEPAAAEPVPAEPPARTPEAAPSSVMATAATLIRAGDVVEARSVLSAALRSKTLTEAESSEVRGTLAVLNNGMVFGPEVTPGDPFTRLYEIKPGDALSRIANREGTQTNWRFLQRINGIADPSRIRVGQRVKIVQGPFHAEVDKGAHRIDLWLGEGEDAVYVRSLPVGLGEFGSTPEGAFRVRRGGKMVNPSWTNPRTGERFAASDPENPIGEFWIGLDGIDPHNLQEQGFGIHGTIEPDSIGRDQSMGCVRLGDEDIALVYEMLTEGNSVVLVRE